MISDTSPQTGICPSPSLQAQRRVNRALCFATVQLLATCLSQTGAPSPGLIASAGAAEIGKVVATTEAAVLSPEAQTGEKLFNQHCITCHQPGAKGMVGMAPSIRNPDFLALASDEFIHNTIRTGRMGTPMVARPDLKDAEITSIIAFLRSVSPTAYKVKAHVDWTRKFSGNADAGGIKFATYCSPCHGPKGEGYVAGVVGSAIGLPGFLKVASDDYILQTLKLGRIGTPMQPFVGAKGLANLQEQDVYDIIAHLRKLGDNYFKRMTGPPGPGDLIEGERQFVANCAPCHQVGGGGKVGFAPSIRNRDFLALASDDFLRETLKNGRPGTAMMARPDLPGQTVNDIIAYLRAVPTQVKVGYTVDPAKKHPGDAAEGAAKYMSYCSYCHGANGEGYVAGLPGTSIGLAGFLNVTSDDYIYQTVKHGRIGTPMKPFIGALGVANLNDKDVGDIIAHLRTLPTKQAAGAGPSAFE